MDQPYRLQEGASKRKLLCKMPTRYLLLKQSKVLGDTDRLRGGAGKGTKTKPRKVQ
jgi:hypothetical protein